MDEQDETQWLLLILLLSFSIFKEQPQSSQQVNTLIDPSSMPFSLVGMEKYNNEKKIQENCENIEWEQDMGMHIPFCKLDGKLCNVQCTKGFFNGL